MLELIASLVQPILGPLLDRIPDPNERARAKEQAEASMIAAMTSLVEGQLEINKVEAEHHSVFVAGWRPFIGWVCGVGFAYNFIVHPLLQWGAVMLPEVAVNLEQMPQLDIGELMSLTLGMLGLGGLRTYEKRVGVDTKRVKKEKE
jgi:hypothetical protein